MNDSLNILHRIPVSVSVTKSAVSKGCCTGPDEGHIAVIGIPGINHPVEPGKSYEVNGISFETVAMYNKLKPFHPKKAGWCGYIIEVAGTRIYIAGDIDNIDEAKAVKCDVAMIPIGGFYTMNYKEGADLINTMKPKAAIPTHYGTAVGSPSDGENFAKLVDKDIQVEIKLSF